MYSKELKEMCKGRNCKNNMYDLYAVNKHVDNLAKFQLF